MSMSAGSIRRSFAVATFAPGAVVDLRGEGGAPLSVVMAGLEEWERSGSLQKIWLIREPRLEKKLKVKQFQLPPVGEDDESARHLTGVRYPNWQQCPGCNELKEVRGWSEDPGKAGLYCKSCTEKAPGQKKQWVIPVRFIVSCTHGHLDEFPWHWWVGHRAKCSRKKPLKLESRAAGLAGLILSCADPECRAERSMDGIFGKEALRGLGLCGGRRPWLRAQAEPCGEIPRAMQRGASNLYFPIVESALTIPPFSERIIEQLTEYWQAILDVEDAHRLHFVNSLWANMNTTGITPEQVVALAAAVKTGLSSVNEDADLRGDEYPVLNSGQKYQQHGEEFELRPGEPGMRIAPLILRINRINRMREVRAVRAFTRITPPTGDFKLDGTKASWLARAPQEWLPAIEVRGEGIFVSLQMTRLATWEAQEAVIRRVEKLDEAHKEHFIQRFGEELLSARKSISARFLLVHGLAHALMRHLALDCGYSSASLRERVYAGGAGVTGMAGVLIYTATTDADGTLGGLVRQGRPHRFEELLVGAIRELQWCASDPLCIEGMTGVAESMNGAACHGCMLASETSCEHFNQMLDRALLVGTPSDASIGFFASLLN